MERLLKWSCVTSVILFSIEAEYISFLELPIWRVFLIKDLKVITPWKFWRLYMKEKLSKISQTFDYQSSRQGILKPNLSSKIHEENEAHNRKFVSQLPIKI